MNYSTILLAMVSFNNKVVAFGYLHVRMYYISAGIGGFLPAVKQIANVAALPGIVGVSYNASYHFRSGFSLACMYM